MSFENVFGYIAFITSVVGLLPQVYKAIQTKSTRDVSMMMLMNYIVCSIAWIGYSFYCHSAFVFFSNVLGLVSSVVLVYLKMHYDTKVIYD